MLWQGLDADLVTASLTLLLALAWVWEASIWTNYQNILNKKKTVDRYKIYLVATPNFKCVQCLVSSVHCSVSIVQCPVSNVHCPVEYNKAGIGGNSLNSGQLPDATVQIWILLPLGFNIFCLLVCLHFLDYLMVSEFCLQRSRCSLTVPGPPEAHPQNIKV